MENQLKIGVLAEQRYLSQSQPSGMYKALQGREVTLALLDPQEMFCQLGDNRWLDGFDLLVGRGRSAALLCLLEWAEVQGILTINRQAAITAVYNKAHMSVRLAAGGIPVPTTYFGSIPQLAAAIAPASYPIILKPIFGDNSQGLRVIETPEEMASTAWVEPVALAQQYLPNDGYDLKLYGIGDEVWGVRKASPFNPPKTATGNGAERVELSPTLEELGRRCGRIFGLELYGVDCIERDGETLVIEINDFPNYTGVPQADERLADYVLRRAREGRTSEGKPL